MNAADLPRKEIEVPEWADALAAVGSPTLYVRTLTGRDQDALQRELANGRSDDGRLTMDNYTAQFVAYCLVDKDGTRIFSDDDIWNLGNKSSAALSRVFKAAREFNQMTEDSLKAAEKN